MAKKKTDTSVESWGYSIDGTRAAIFDLEPGEAMPPGWSAVPHVHMTAEMASALAERNPGPAKTAEEKAAEERQAAIEKAAIEKMAFDEAVNKAVAERIAATDTSKAGKK